MSEYTIQNNNNNNNNSANGDKQSTPNNTPKSKLINCNQYPIIGIDLGISYWSAATVQNGKIHVIPICGKNHIPAFVAYTANEFKFGNEAKQMFFDNREVTIFDILYILGLNFNSGGELEEHMNDYSYILCNSGGAGKVEGVGEKPKLSFLINNNKKSEIYIEEIFDIIINNLIYTSEIFLNKTIHNIVLPIPVYFKECQKSALLRATSHVGIVDLIVEPIAAAYAYSIHEKYKNDQKVHKFLVYNLQEDNLDVSVVHFVENKFHLKSNVYERHLKKNYTFRFLDELCTQTYETYFISNPRFHPINSGTLRYYCKTIFEAILYEDCFEIEMDTVREEKITRRVSRAELDELLLILVHESLTSVESVLREANLTKHDIDEVLLVGQITRHTIVRQQLKFFFGRNCLNCSLNPEDALVIGAAVRAHLLQEEICHHAPDAFNMRGKSANENLRSYEAEDVEKRTKSNKINKSNSIRKRKAKLSLRDKMLSMCTLFTDVVSKSNLKMSVKEKLLFVPAYLRNKLRNRSCRRIKNDIINRRDLCLEHKNPTEHIPDRVKQVETKIQPNSQDKSILDYFETPILECCDFYSQNIENVEVNKSKRNLDQKQIYYETPNNEINKSKPNMGCFNEQYYTQNIENLEINKSKRNFDQQSLYYETPNTKQSQNSGNIEINKSKPIMGCFHEHYSLNNQNLEINKSKPSMGCSTEQFYSQNTENLETNKSKRNFDQKPLHYETSNMEYTNDQFRMHNNQNIDETNKSKRKFDHYYEKQFKECMNEDFYDILNTTECVGLNLIPSKAFQRNHGRPMKTTQSSRTFMSKINCVRSHLDMYYVTVCFVVFLLHWASENICINIAIALISIAITLILNNRTSLRKITSN